MPVGWNDLAFRPSPELTAEIAAAWEWLIGDQDWSPVLCSRLGDLFFERSGGGIDWLSCSSGIIHSAAPDRRAFDAICRSWDEPAAEWFGPALVEQLHVSGKIAGPADCYAFLIQPVFAECRYVPDNLVIVPVREVFVGLSGFHQQLTAIPDGQKVQIKVID
ncbi:MAG: hypothetical protein ABL912_13325 [Novosphingobium sp.]